MAINLERFVKAKRFTEDHVLDDASDQILVKVATDSVAGKVALNLGTSLPGDATNCTDALTACGLNALLADATVGGNTVINGIKALIPDTAKTVRGLVNLTDLQQMGDGRKVFDASVHVGNGNPAFASRSTVTAVGQNAGASNTGLDQTAIGRLAGNANTGAEQSVLGRSAGQLNTGASQSALGTNAGRNNTGGYQTTMGFLAGVANVGSEQTAMGVTAGNCNTGNNATMVGSSAGAQNTGNNNSFFGAYAGTQYGATIGTVTITPTSGTAGTFTPALPGSVVGKSIPVTIQGFSNSVLTFTSTTSYTTNFAPASGSWTVDVFEGLKWENVTALGYAAEPTTSNQVTLGNGAVTEVRTAGTYFGAGFTTTSDATLKENVEAIDPVKALQFRNGLSWKKYEMFSEQQVQIMQDVTSEVQKTDAEGNPVVDADGNPVMETVTTKVPTGRYEVKRNSQGIKRGLIAQEVQALAASIGDFSDVVVEVGEYFTLDAQGYPVKDAQGNNIVNKRLGLDYDAVSFIVMCAEQSLLIPA